MFSLINLPYSIDALEPVISARTLEFHYGKHLQAYVDNLNKLLPGSGLEGKTLEEIIVKTSVVVIPSGAKESGSVISSGVEKSIFNNAGQVLNHEMYFTQFKPYVIPSAAKESSSVISSEVEKSPLLSQIEKQWGSLDDFKADFEAKGVGLFGSGWVWLQADANGELSIGKYSGADNPVAHGLKPLLTFDVWEHAYYLDYQNRRATYLHELWKIVDWNVVQQRYR